MTSEDAFDTCLNELNSNEFKTIKRVAEMELGKFFKAEGMDVKKTGKVFFFPSLYIDSYFI